MHILLQSVIITFIARMAVANSLNISNYLKTTAPSYHEHEAYGINNSFASNFCPIPNIPTLENSLHSAIKLKDFKEVDRLINLGFDINAKNEKGETPLNFLMNENNYDPEIAKILIKNGSDINSRDEKGHPILHKAIAHGINAVNMLLKNGVDHNILAQYPYGPFNLLHRSHNALEISILKKDPELIKELLNFIPNKNKILYSITADQSSPFNSVNINKAINRQQSYLYPFKNIDHIELACNDPYYSTVLEWIDSSLGAILFLGLCSIPAYVSIYKQIMSDEAIDFKNKDFQGLNYQGVDFSGINIHGAKFNNAILKNANFDLEQLSHEQAKIVKKLGAKIDINKFVNGKIEKYKERIITEFIDSDFYTIIPDEIKIKIMHNIIFDDCFMAWGKDFAKERSRYDTLDQYAEKALYKLQNDHKSTKHADEILNEREKNNSSKRQNMR